MKLSDVAKIEDPFARFIQTTKFLRSLKETEELAAEIRDRALLDVRKDEETRPSQQQLADYVGTTVQRINNMEKKARERYAEDGRALPT